MYDGVIIVGDLNGNLASLLYVVRYAKQNNLLIVVVGSLYGSGKDPYHISKIILEMIEDDQLIYIDDDDDRNQTQTSIPCFLYDDFKETNEKIESYKRDEYIYKSWTITNKIFVNDFVINKYLKFLQSTPKKLKTIILSDDDFKEKVFTHRTKVEYFPIDFKSTKDTNKLIA